MTIRTKTAPAKIAFARTTLAKLALGGLVIFGVGEWSATAAQARGGGSNFMNSPGYQRRLQESRGYVTNNSGSLVTRPAVEAPPARAPRLRKRR